MRLRPRDEAATEAAGSALGAVSTLRPSEGRSPEMEQCALLAEPAPHPAPAAPRSARPASSVSGPPPLPATSGGRGALSAASRPALNETRMVLFRQGLALALPAGESEKQAVQHDGMCTATDLLFPFAALDSACFELASSQSREEEVTAHWTERQSRIQQARDGRRLDAVQGVGCGARLRGAARGAVPPPSGPCPRRPPAVDSSERWLTGSRAELLQVGRHVQGATVPQCRQRGCLRTPPAAALGPPARTDSPRAIHGNHMRRTGGSGGGGGGRGGGGGGGSPQREGSGGGAPAPKRVCLRFPRANPPPPLPPFPSLHQQHAHRMSFPAPSSPHECEVPRCYTAVPTQAAKHCALCRRPTRVPQSCRPLHAPWSSLEAAEATEIDSDCAGEPVVTGASMQQCPPWSTCQAPLLPLYTTAAWLTCTEAADRGQGSWTRAFCCTLAHSRVSRMLACPFRVQFLQEWSTEKKSSRQGLNPPPHTHTHSH